MGGCIGGWVDWWVNGWARSNTKYQINLDLIERIQFCLKIYDGSIGRSMGGGQVKSLKIE